MQSARLSASTRFFLALAVLLAALTAVVSLGLYGLGEVHAANEQLFADNLRTAQATAAVSGDLGDARAAVLQIAGAPQGSTVLRFQLAQTIVPRVDRAVTALVRIHAGDPRAERAQIQRISTAWTQTRAALASDHLLTGAPASLTTPDLAASQRRAATAIGSLITLVQSRQATEASAAAAAHANTQATYDRGRVWLLVAAIVAALAAAVMLRAGLTLRRLLEDQSARQRYAELTGEFTALLQATGNEDEAHELLRRQVERASGDGAAAVVLARNNSDDRLEPRTGTDAIADLREPLEHATPRSCLAIRFAGSHLEGAARTPLVSCELCGRLPGVSTCEPLLVGGTVIGSVLVNHPRQPHSDSCAHIREAVSQAAPVLANLRNLAIAELRAATDRLTGLPNQRAVQDTLKRMVAQASRTITPLSAVLIDLDHFKKINDVHGHDRGDEALAAVGVALSGILRDSDFVGRYGGEEFLVLLPDTDKDGALHVAEAARAAIAGIRIPRLEQFTASAGIATIPDDAGDPINLFRAADRALYAAKNNGRNQTQAAEPQRAVQPGEVEVATPDRSR